MTYFIAGYLIFLLFYLVFSVAGIYHLNRYGYAGDYSKPVIIVYSVATLLIIAGSLIYIFTY